MIAEQRSTERIAAQCKDYIGRNIYEKIYLTDIAKSIGVNPNYLSGCFSKAEGITLQEYIQREKIEAACKLLRYSDRKVAEVARFVGFQSQSSFSAVFRKWKLMTPTEYRLRYRKTSR